MRSSLHRHISFGVADLPAVVAFHDAATAVDPDGHRIEAIFKGAV